MKTLALVSLAFLAMALPARAFGAEFEQRWVYAGGNLADEEGYKAAVAFLEQAKAAGCTHIQLNEGNIGRADRMTPEYAANVKRYLAEADKLGIAVIPGVFRIGYSGRYVGREPNLAAGIPARDVAFIVRDGIAAPDPSTTPSPANAGFDDADGNRLSGWTRQDLPGDATFVDTEVTHGGKASLKITNLDKLPASANGSVRIAQTLPAKPFQVYIVSVWIKSDDIQAEGEDYVVITSSGGKRRNSYQNLRVRPSADWTRYQTVFNTLEATEIDFSVGVSDARGGTIWFDDLTIEPAGLINILRREPTPFKVTSADGSVAYEEGRDFAPVSDPMLRAGDLSHPAPVIRLTADSRITNGETLLVSWFHPIRIYNDQVCCSLTDPRILEMMEEEMKSAAEVWKVPGFFMGYDEIRVGGWEVQPGGTNLTPAQLLARHVTTAISYIRKYAPDAAVYAWSDMFTPYHNARPFEVKGYYYLVNGNWDGAWEALPKDVVIANWYSPTKESAQWWATRGHKQILAGYYDGPMKPNIEKWMEVTDGVPGVIGMMYTTWQRNYRDMNEFFQLVKSYPSWVEKKPAGETGMNEK